MAVKSLIGGAVDVAPPADVQPFRLTDAVAGVAGKVYYFNRIGAGDYRLAVSTVQRSDTAVVVLEDADAGTDIDVRGAWIMPGIVYKAPLTQKDGDALSATAHTDVRVGARLGINDTGLGVDAETDYNAKDGPLSVIKVDRTNNYVWVVFNTCYTNMNLATIA